ncbi:MAG: hypothetical protein KDA28_14405, partial [Phycisphaerales bacterium]|nr:hypothetical protein [Phycisphaerales bacterium]
SDGIDDGIIDDDSDLTIAVDPTTNSLLLLGSSRLAERAAQLVETLEAQMPAEPVGVNVVRLPDTIDARNILTVIRQTLQQIGQVGLDNPGGFTGEVATALDPDGNAVIIWANETDFESIRSLVAAISRPVEADEVTVKLYPLENVPALRAKSSIEDLLQPSPSGRQAQQVRRDMALRIDGFEAVIDPESVHVTTDPGESALIVVAPDRAVPVIDRFVSLIDQNPVKDRLAIRRYELENAQADDMSRMLEQVFEAQRQGPMRREMAEARFVADERTNSILVTASSDQHEEVVRLLAAADRAEDRSGLELAILPLQQARSSTVEAVVREIIVARDPGREIIISGDDDSNMLVVFAEPEDLEDIRRIVREVDTTSADLPVRTLKLEHADAQ